MASGYTGMTVAEVLAKGEWTELQDSSTRRKYYYNKNTRKTTWDLVKELGLSAPSPAAPPLSSQVATPTRSANAASDDGSSGRKVTSLADALSFGGWTERVDPASKKTYYVHQSTKRTTWDLQKELGLTESVSQPVSTVPVGTGGDHSAVARQPRADTSSSEVEAPVGRGAATAAEAIASGEWVRVQDHTGRVFFRKPTTNETTGNLDLYLQIMAAVRDDPFDPNIAESLKKKQPDQKLLEDRLALVLNAPGAKDAAKRLLRQQLEADGRLDPLFKAQDRLLAEQQRNSKLAEALRVAEDTAQRLREEVHQLQCALFFGLGSAARQYNPPGTHAVSANTLRGGNVPDERGVWKGDSLASSSESGQRVRYLEDALRMVQEHNRMLVAELEQERTSKHFHATCGKCLSLDPWQRLIQNTVGTETAASRIIQESRSRR
jgi:hypothetical protein